MTKLNVAAMNYLKSFSEAKMANVNDEVVNRYAWLFAARSLSLYDRTGEFSELVSRYRLHGLGRYAVALAKREYADFANLSGT